jgi:hypothetical protein
MLSSFQGFRVGGQIHGLPLCIEKKEYQGTLLGVNLLTFLVFPTNLEYSQ